MGVEFWGRRMAPIAGYGMVGKVTSCLVDALADLKGIDVQDEITSSGKVMPFMTPLM